MKNIFLISVAVLLIAATAGAYYYINASARGIEAHKSFDERVNKNGITDTEILIGTSSALSGHAALLGSRYLNGTMAYINEANARGGINGRKITVVAYDDQYDPPKTVANTQKLIQSDKVFLLFDYVGTPTSVKIIDMAEEAKIPVFGLFTGAEELRTPFRQYIFNVRASYYDETEAAVSYFVDKLGFGEIAVFYQDDAFGMAGLKGTELALKKRNMMLSAKGSYARGTTDIAAGLDAIKAEKPDAIIMIGTYSPLAKFVNHYRFEGFDPYFHSVSFVGAEAFASELSGYGINSSDKIIVTQIVPDPHEASAEYVGLLSKYFPGEPVTYTGLEGYANAVLLVKALKAAGRDINREKFIGAAESMKRENVLGVPATFGPKDHQAFDIVYFSRLNKENFEIFEPL